jgi:hypothetical protein
MSETSGTPQDLFANSGKSLPTTQETHMCELVAEEDFGLVYNLLPVQAISRIREAYPDVTFKQENSTIHFGNCPAWACTAERLLQMAIVKISEADPPACRDNLNTRRYFVAHA